MADLLESGLAAHDNFRHSLTSRIAPAFWPARWRRVWKGHWSHRLLHGPPIGYWRPCTQRSRRSFAQSAPRGRFGRPGAGSSGGL